MSICFIDSPADKWELIKKEPFPYWDPFLAQIDCGKMVHVVTDDGAYQNPGKAG
jgi:hypothetical protein